VFYVGVASKAAPFYFTEECTGMQKEMMPKGYEPKEAESRWYRYWEDHQLFRAAAKSEKEPYCIVIPPPNVTGSLHMGHALNNTLQDILCRYKRMRGYNVLWQPGTDHAGIATQNVVERDLALKGTDRHQVGRKKFIELVWEWKEKYGGVILTQLKRLGCSCDWSRERFTMDEGLSRAVREVFVRLYEEGLIYRGVPPWPTWRWNTRRWKATSTISVIPSRIEMARSR
jgi:valyl-tRNA synthetase